MHMTTCTDLQPLFLTVCSYYHSEKSHCFCILPFVMCLMYFKTDVCKDGLYRSYGNTAVQLGTTPSVEETGMKRM